MLATIMQILDISIVNVSLPNMQGAFSATPDQISWVITSYLVASAILMPLTGYFTQTLGQKPFLTIAVTGFTLTSILCGISTSLDQIVLFRLLQGIFGASLVPLSQAILLDIYPKHEHGRAMALWGAGVMVGPILGPTLGGYLTEMFSWRWAFYINVPIGTLCLFLIATTLPNTERTTKILDWPTLICMACAVGGFQFVLDRGNESDWFESMTILSVFLLGLFATIGYIILSTFRKNTQPLFSTALFRDSNFVFASIMIAMMGLGLFGTIIIQTLMLQNLLDYPAHLAGLTVAPRGLASMFTMIFVGKIAHRIEAKPLILAGLLFNVVGTYLCTHFSLDISPVEIIIPNLIQGVGLGLVFAPLSTLALSTLPLSLRSEGAGLFSLTRTFGLSIGTSIAITILTRNTQTAWNQIRGAINPFNVELYTYLNKLNLNPTEPLSTAIISQEVYKQASMIAVLDVFIVITYSFAAIIPLALLLKSRQETA